MKKYYFTIASILVFVMGITSCSNEENKTQNQVAARPTVPLQNGEVQIGTQIWMTKNLNVSHYRNGDPIPQVTDPTQWASLTTGAWCYYYQNNQAYGTVYGKLYNLEAVNDSRGLAPTGWHLPSDGEWTTLTDYLGGQDVAGAKMKSAGNLASSTGLWSGSNYVGTNSSGFTGLPGGLRDDQGLSIYIGNLGCWWSSTPGSSGLLLRVLQYDSDVVGRGSSTWSAGYSVRCIKD